MTEQLDVQQMAQRLLTADNILILCHKNPDGDTIGCGSALYYALKALEKTTAVLCSDAIPSRYAFTNPRLFKGEFEPRTVIAVDVAGLQLFGENNGVPQFARHVDLCIDHHAGNNGYADFTLLDASAAAAAELLYQVIVEMGVTITPHIADCLYTGIATDTGCFKFSSTTANTHKVAAKLIEAGCHVEELNTLLFDTKPRARMEAERIARNHLEYYLDGRCALIYLTRDEIRQSGVDPADLEELTGLPIVSELMDEAHIDEFEQYVDVVQIGARNMQNFQLLKAVGKMHKPVLLKRGLANTIEEWIMSAEYIMAGGNENVILCERGIRTFERATRNTLDLSAVPVIKDKTHQPIIVDPSHATGDYKYIESMALAAVAAGADGLEIEVHNDPPHAWSDGAQCLKPDKFAEVIAKCRKVAAAIGREM